MLSDNEFKIDSSLIKNTIRLLVPKDWETKLLIEEDLVIVVPTNFPKDLWQPNIVITAGNFLEICDPEKFLPQYTEPGFSEWTLVENNRYSATFNEKPASFYIVAGSYKEEKNHFASSSIVITWVENNKTYVVSLTGSWAFIQNEPYGKTIMEILNNIEIKNTEEQKPNAV